MKHEEYFQEWYKHVFKWEGKRLNEIVYVDGDNVATNHGIRESTWNGLATRLFKIPQNQLYSTFRNMKPEWHEGIGRYFWNLGGGANFDDGRIAAFFAEVVWGGGNGAIKHYQRWYNQTYKGNLKTDGANGVSSSAAFNKLNQDKLFQDLITQMYVRYENIIAAKPALGINKKGWFRRVVDFKGKFEYLYAKKKICECCGQHLLS